ncbi:hypothetical protein [Kribbella deserti]|uniref:Uncharacterized protein n=1 Tax=Kribbella deserti TaxID=1926257 RepID=A0ABV6QX99_9ACTN
MRFGSALALAGLAAAPMLAVPATAQADVQALPPCTLLVPAKIRVVTPNTAVTFREGADCKRAGVVSSSWRAYNPDNVKPFPPTARFEYGSTSMVHQWPDHYWGLWRFKPQWAWDDDVNQVATQNTPATWVKMGSWAQVTATRVGSKVTLRTSSARYAHTSNKFVAWAGSVGQLQYKAPGTTTWKPLKSVKSSSLGKYAYTYTSAAARDYRVYFVDATLIWGGPSATVRK